MFATKISKEKITGSLLGAALGDALAFPYSGYSTVFTGTLDQEAIKQFKEHRSGNYSPGQVTSFSQLAFALADALSGENQKVTSELVGSSLLSMVYEGRLVKPDHHLVSSIKAWVRSSVFKREKEGTLPVHLLPLAFLKHENEEELLNDLTEASKPTGHDFPEALAAAAAFLFSIRYVLKSEDVVLGEMVDVMRSAALHFSREVALEINKIPDHLYLSDRDGVTPVVQKGTDQLIFQLISGLMGFLRSPYDCKRSLLIVLKNGAGSAGAFVCGALSGAFNGEKQLPNNMLKRIVGYKEAERTADIFSLSLNGR